MPSSPATGAPSRRGTTQIVIWTVFMALLALGVVLWFRFGDRIVPMLDVITDR